MGEIVEVALIKGDGTAPELMDVSCPCVEVAAEKYSEYHIKWVPAPMGWCTWDEHHDTYPETSREVVKRCGISYYGGVGEKKLDDTLGEQFPGMKPEGRTLLGQRVDLGLVVNGRPNRLPYDLRHSMKVKPEFIPEQGVMQWWMRFLLEDGYFGTRNLIGEIPPDLAERLGIKLKKDVTGNEDRVVELAYYTRENIDRFARYAFAFAERYGLPVIDIHKANILARSLYWKKIIDRIHAESYAAVPYSELYVDAATSMLYQPALFNGVMFCGNEHGDIISDAALGAWSMGMMSSFAINPETGQGMFESGAGTCPELKGKDVANPIGRIWTGAHLLRYSRLRAYEAADAIEHAIWSTLSEGWRTLDIASKGDDPKKIVGTTEMAALIQSRI